MGSREILELFINEENYEVDIETMIEIAFAKYKEIKKHSVKYNSYDFVPQNLIKLYYSSDNNRSDFSRIMKNFKKRYIEQESKLEGVHTVEEIDGLGVVYDYIRSDDWKMCPNIYILMMINLKLYSLTPYPEAGGKLRNANCILEGSGINAYPYNQISAAITELYPVFDQLLKRGEALNANASVDTEDMIIDYIDACLRLKCHLIEIHPFPDGNGRTTRALVNLLFKVAGLPPVYVRSTERKKYLKAMNKAIVEKDYSLINKFYYYKICDSILQLDVNERIKKDIKLRKLTK
ncbi:MAG: Fic family protein [Bacilli bacterium]|nr:Fic family protein [Bacilli bacterium]